MQIVIAVIEFILAIGYAMLLLGTEERVLRMVCFAFAVMCVVAGTANLM